MQTINAHELKQIRNVTSNYFFWQGLRLVPLGVVIIALGLRDSQWWRLTETWKDVFIISLVGLGLAISPFVGRYYRRTFGQVRDDPHAHHRRETTKWFLVYPLMISSLVIDMIYRPAFFLTGLAWSGAILAYWWSTGRGRTHYLIASVCMLALTPVQWLGFVEPGRQMFSVFGVLLGAIYIVGGMLDHLALCRILRPLKES